MGGFWSPVPTSGTDRTGPINGPVTSQNERTGQRNGTVRALNERTGPTNGPVTAKKREPPILTVEAISMITATENVHRVVSF